MKKIKLFLGGYVNFTNAQNLNCRALAKYLNKDKYEVAAMLFPTENIAVNHDLDGVKLFKMRRPVKLWRYITYFRALLWCDVAYLPKGEIFEFNYAIARIFRKKTFITVEGVIDKESYQGMMSICNNDSGIRRLYNSCSKTFSITKFMSCKNKQLLNIKSDGVLYLGVETSRFMSSAANKVDENKNINVIFIGNDVKRKRVDEYLRLAKQFPTIKFHIVGGGGNILNNEIFKLGISNVVYHGILNHEELSFLLQTMSLHVFPSRSEGFPKVTLETAAAGVPSVVYSDYGAAEWIDSGKNGFVVDEYNQIVDIIKDLQQHPEKLESLSSEAVAMAKRFDWSVLVKDWERAIEDTYCTNN